MKTKLTKSSLIASFFVLSLFAADAKAQSGGGAFGAGIIVGDPSGLSAKYNLDSNSAVDAAVGWSLTNGNRFHFHSSYLWHFRGLVPMDQDSIDLHVGAGLRLSQRNDKGQSNDGDTSFGLRIPVGLDYQLKNIPIEIFFELAGVIDFVPSSKFFINAALGARYYF